MGHHERPAHAHWDASDQGAARTSVGVNVETGTLTGCPREYTAMFL